MGRGSHCLASPRRSGRMLRPSMGYFEIAGMLASSAKVGSRSIAPEISSIDSPAGISLGQRIKKGERTPPSSMAPFRPFMSPFHRNELGPLSEKKMTMVLLSISSSSSFAKIRPTFQSMFSHMARAARVIIRSSSSGSRLRISGSASRNFA